MKDGKTTKVVLGGLLDVTIRPAKDHPEISTLMIRVTPDNKSLPSFAEPPVNDEATAADHILTLLSKALKETGMEEMPNEQPYHERTAAARGRAEDHGHPLHGEGHATIDAGVGSFPERNPKSKFNGEAMSLHAEIALRKIDRYLTDAIDIPDATEKLAAAAFQISEYGKTLDEALDPSQHEVHVPDQSDGFTPSKFTPRQNKMIDAIHDVLPEKTGPEGHKKPLFPGNNRFTAVEAIVAGVIGLNDAPPTWTLKPDADAADEAAIKSMKLRGAGDAKMRRSGRRPGGEEPTSSPQEALPPDKDDLTRKVLEVLKQNVAPGVHEMETEIYAAKISDVILKQLDLHRGAGDFPKH